MANADISVLIDVIGADDMVRATKTADRMRKEYSRLDQAFNKGNINAQQYAKGVRQVDGRVEELIRSARSHTKVAQAQAKAIEGTTAALRRQGAAAGQGSNNMASYDIATYRANQSTKRFASVGLQQAGYQVGDFAVQLQGGTNAAVAFGQQGSQLLGIFGAFGAVLGAALAVTTAIVAPLLDSAEAGGKMADEMDNLKDQLNTLEPAMKAVTNAANFMKEALIGATNLLLNNLDRVLVYATTLAAFFAGKWVKGFVAARVVTLSLAGALVTLRGALIRTGFGALIVAAGELVYQFTRLVKGAGGLGEAFSLLSDVAKDIFTQKIVGWFDIMQVKAKENFFRLKSGALKALSGVLEYLGSTWVNTAIGVFVGAKDSVVAAWGALPGAFKSLGAKAINGMAELIERGVKRIVEPLNTILEGVNLDPIQVAFGDPVNDPGMPNVGQKIRDAFSSALDTDYFEGLSDSISNASDEALQSAQGFKSFAEGLETFYDRPIESIEKLREAMARADEEGSKINIRDWFGGLSSSEDKEGDSGGKSAAEEAADQLKKVQEQAQSIADTIKNSMSDAFMSIVDGTKTAKDAFKEMARSILKQLYDVLVVQQLVGSFNAQTGQGSGIVGAIMGAFTGGAAQISGPTMGAAAASAPPIRPFADGGVVNGPTVFPMANGTGLMGEAGPEAIMPLKRGKNGKLGVQSEGGQGNVTVENHFHIAANGDDSVKRIIQQEAPKIANYTQQQILDQRRRGGAMKSTFGG